MFSALPLTILVYSYSYIQPLHNENNDSKILVCPKGYVPQHGPKIESGQVIHYTYYIIRTFVANCFTGDAVLGVSLHKY